MNRPSTRTNPAVADDQGGLSLLLVGGPAAGKTVYGTQLLGRMQVDKGALRLRGAAPSILPFEEAFARLANGLAPEHTGTAVYHEVTLPVVASGGVRVDLVWPDYGGEQVRALVEHRIVPPEWRDRIRAASGWVLVVRLDQLRTPDDLLTRPHVVMASAADSDADTGSEVMSLSAPAASEESRSGAAQATLIELLQILLFAKGVGTLTPVHSPPLMILLSCWDELPEAGEEARTPSAVLRQQLPMFAEYVSATWGQDVLTVLGLSSQGQHLRSDEPDSNYVTRGPDQFGYIVLDDASRSPDLTIPIVRLLRQIVTT